MTNDAAAISVLSVEDLARRTAELTALLVACVHGGASIGFVLPFGEQEAEAFWTRKVLPGVGDGTRVLLAAEANGRIVGTVQLGHDTPANQPHRADVNKLMVHPDFRRRGIARALMAEVERILHESIKYGLAHREEALAHALQYARDMDVKLADKFVGMYVNDWTLDYGDRGRAAVRKLLDEAHKAGVIEKPVAVEFVE